MRRVGAALVERIRQIEANAKFIVIEAAQPTLARAISEFWDDADPRLPQLAVAAEDATTYGHHGLVGASAATLRHRDRRGLCLVVCEGYDLAERQSLRSFVPVSPGDLLQSKSLLLLLARAVQPVRADGPMAAVRDALVTLPAGQRPSALRVGAFFDAVAAGEDPMEALPVIGGFRDPDVALADVRGERIVENLELAAGRRRDDVVRPANFGDVRTRAARVLGRRTGAVADALAARFMELLESGSDEVLRFASYDEAREILTAGPKQLSAQVRQALVDHRRRLTAESRDAADAIPWQDYRAAADALDRVADRKQGATDLLDFDAAEGERVFLAETRRKLQALLRDRSISGTAGSALEAALARAIRSLGAVPERITLVDPHPPVHPSSQTAAREWLTLAAARLRLAPLLRRLENTTGCEVDGGLAVEPFDGLDAGEISGLFVEAGLQAGGLPSLKLRVQGASGRVELSWAPDIDDVALLRCLVEFSEDAALSFTLPEQPDAYGAAVGDWHASPVPRALQDLAAALSRLARDLLRDGLRAERLRTWTSTWHDAVTTARGFSSGRTAEAAGLAGCIVSLQPHAVGMTALAPLKAEWLADYVESSALLVDAALESVAVGADEHQAARTNFDTASDGLARATASHCPPFLRLSTLDQPLLPAREGRLWSVFGGTSGISRLDVHAAAATEGALVRLLRLQPEAAGHLRCLAFGPGAADLLLQQAIGLAGKRIQGVAVERVEVFVVGDDLPAAETLAAVDDHLGKSESQAVIQLRYLDSLEQAQEQLGSAGPGVHFALVTGLTSGGSQPTVATVEIQVPEPSTESLFSPRVWQREDKEHRVLLMPPGPTLAMLAWLKLGQAIDDRWPGRGSTMTVPEMRTGIAASVDPLRALHEVSLWVATLDRYASRESLERALGDEVAILHQERRLGSESPIGLVVSQKSGGPVDRAIGRSLRQARIVRDEGDATSIGAQLREVAAQGYGILALEAATSGTGINELVGHVVGFSLLGTTSTPWPLPPNCRVLLINLDEHAGWFLGGKRADLLALAIDVEEGGVHGAVIEVKARRSDSNQASGEALDQLRKTLLATSPAAYPRPGDLASRVWLNRIADAAYGVARESRIRLSAEELAAIEAFRRGDSTLEWAGLGLVFGPEVADSRRVYRQEVENDWVPIALHEIKLTEQRLRDAVATDLRELFTAETAAAPLSGGRSRRRPEAGVARPARDDPPPEVPAPNETPAADSGGRPASTGEGLTHQPSQAPGAGVFVPPVLGWDQVTQEPVVWRVAGEDSLSNGHVQIWGSSGAGKTQFVKMVLAQLALGNGARFGVADFKNDYGPTATEDFPASVDAAFLDLWGRPGAPYNPLALASEDDRAALDSRIIEFRDCVEQAMASFQRIGPRQKQSIARALESAYANARAEGRWPTMLDLNREVSADIEHVLGDLTRYEIFSDGPPLESVIDQNVVFALNRIPGNGQTTVLAAAFILSVIGLTMQERPPVANAVHYAMVVDEAHRVAQFKALHLMLREGRSKGLAVVLATQAPADFPEVVDNNAQTRVCFRLSDAVIAGQAARKMDPNDGTLAERIRTLASGEAFVSFEGSPPRLLTMVQHYRDRARLDAGELGGPRDESRG